jgi:hypothetical protein
VPDETPSTEPSVEQPAAEDAASEPSATGPAAADTTTPGGYSYTVVDDEAAPDDGGGVATEHAGGIHPLALVGAALLAAAVAGVAVWFFAPSSGGGGTSRLGADVTNVLNAFSQGQPGTITTRYEGELPAGFPGDMPRYAGAKVVASIAQVHGEDVGYLVIWDTSDARDKVAADFQTKFGADPWQIDGGQDARDSTLHQFSKINDPNVTGLVLVAESKGGSTTTILESVQVTTGAKDSKTPAWTPIGDRSVPDGFPSSVPAYAGATIIESAYKKQTGSLSFAVSYITKDGADGVLDFYRGKLTDAKLTVTDGDASTSSLAGAKAIDFVDAGKTVQGEIVVGKFAEDASYTRIDVSVQTKKAASTP